MAWQGCIRRHRIPAAEGDCYTNGVSFSQSDILGIGEAQRIADILCSSLRASRAHSVGHAHFVWRDADFRERDDGRKDSRQ